MIFVFKLNTANAVRISDWISDMCSSDHQLERYTQKTDPRPTITFPNAVPANFTEDEVRGVLEQQSYTRIHHEETIARVDAPTTKKTASKKKHASKGKNTNKGKGGNGADSGDRKSTRLNSSH